MKQSLLAFVLCLLPALAIGQDAAPLPIPDDAPDAVGVTGPIQSLIDRRTKVIEEQLIAQQQSLAAMELRLLERLEEAQSRRHATIVALLKDRERPIAEGFMEIRNEQRGFFARLENGVGDWFPGKLIMDGIVGITFRLLLLGVIVIGAITALGLWIGWLFQRLGKQIPDTEEIGREVAIKLLADGITKKL